MSAAHPNQDWIARHSDEGLEVIAGRMREFLDGGRLSDLDAANCRTLLDLILAEQATRTLARVTRG